MPLSKAAQAALDIAAKRAARVASRDAGWGEFDPPSVEPKPLSEKKKKALEDAKEKSRPRCYFLLQKVEGLTKSNIGLSNLKKTISGLDTIVSSDGNHV